MLALTHLVFSLILISAFRLDRNNAFAVLLFGVLIDLDHAFGMVEFVAKEGLTSSLDYKAAMASNIQWKSMFHSPEAVLLIAPLSANYRYAVPFLAWGAHLSMDYVQIHYLGVMSGIEFLFLALLVITLLCIELRDRRNAVPGTTVRSLMVWETRRLATWFCELPGLRSVIRLLGPRATWS